VARVVWLLLRFWSGAWHRLLRRCTPAGLVVFAVLAASAAVGVDTTRTLAYQIFTLALALLLVALLGSLAFRARIDAQRTLPPFATVGEPVRYGVRLRNEGRRAITAARVGELFADPRPSLADITAWSHTPAPARPSLSPGAVLRRWRALLARHGRVRGKEEELPALAPGEECALTLELTPRRRGAVRFLAVTVVHDDPLGLVKAIVQARAPATLLVLPRRYPVPELPLPGNRQFQPGGVTFASSVGDSEEFVGLRGYRPGDPLQRIHWKSFARLGKPVVREYQSEFFERHALVLDTFWGSQDEAFEEAVAVAASFACDIDTRESLLDLLFVADQAYCYTAGRGQISTDGLLEVLAHVRPAEGDLEVLKQAVLARRAAMSGCILVLLAWDEARRDLAQALEQTGLPVQIFLVTRSDAPAPAAHPGNLRVLVPGRIAEGLAAT
jgi:uncharacterized protein (DUF58 family)